MLSKLCVLSALAMASARTTWKDLDKYDFEQFMAEFHLKYTSSELESRRSLFRDELARVRAHNAKNLSWKEGINKFSAMTPDERKAYHGRSKGVAAAQRKSFKNLKENSAVRSSLTSTADVDTVDWRDSGIVSAVKDQGHCGSCWAFATTATIESYVAKESGLLFDLSVEQIAMCAPNPDSCGGTGGCEGATSEIGMDYVAGSDGLFQEYQYSYSGYYGQDAECVIPTLTTPVATISGFAKLPENNYTALMDAVTTLGPIAISVDASTWHAYESGIYNGCNQEQPDINHAVVLVGYGEDNGEKYWTVRNSWSAAYGEAGYIRIHRGDDEESNCGTDVTPQDGTACAGETEPVQVCGTCGILYDSAYPLGATTL